MKRIVNKVFKEKYCCGLDIGGQTIKAALLRSEDGRKLELLGTQQHKTHGFRESSVHDLAELSECIHTAMDELVKKTGVKIRTVQVGLGGRMVDVREINTVIPLADKASKVITGHDIRKVNEHARLLGIKMEEEILHELPQYYEIDDGNKVNDPRGLYGRKLGIRSLMLIADTNRIHNVIRAVSQAGCDVAAVFFISYAASEVALHAREKEEGCILADIGSQGTSVLIFKENKLKSMTKVNFGGDHLTQSLANQLQMSLDLAEDIKKSYATASVVPRHSEEKVLVKRENAYIPVKKETICQSVESEIQYLIRGIQTALSAHDAGDQTHAGMVLTGGGALLSGLIERIGEETKLPVRLGQMHQILQKDVGNPALFSGAVGLAKQGFQKAWGYPSSSNGRAHWAKDLATRIRELYVEYF